MIERVGDLEEAAQMKMVPSLGDVGLPAEVTCSSGWSHAKPSGR